MQKKVESESDFVSNVIQGKDVLLLAKRLLSEKGKGF